MTAAHCSELPRSRPSTLRAGSVFVATGIVQRAIAVVLLPIFVGHVTTTDYGRLAIAWSIAGALAAIASMGLETAVFRGYFTVAEEHRNAYIVSNALFVVGASGAALGVLAAFVAVIGQFTGGGLPYSYVVLSLAAAALYVSATAVPLAVLRAERRLGAFAAVNLAYVGSYVALMLVLVVSWDKGATGWLVANLGAAAAAALVAFATLWSRRAVPALSWVAAGLAIGLPLVPHTLAHWALSLSDRLLLAIWVSASDIGLYNVAYQLAAGLGLVFVAVNHSVMAEYGRALRGELERASLERLVGRQLSFMLILGIAAAVVGPVVCKALLPAAYDDASALLPWLVLANVLFGLYLIPMNSITLLAGDTRRVWMATVASATVNIVLNAILIPVAGTTAAAATTVASYAVLLAIVILYARRRETASPAPPLPLVLAALAVGAGLSALAIWTSPDALAPAAAMGTAWTLVGAAVILVLLRPGRLRPSAAAGAVTSGA